MAMILKGKPIADKIISELQEKISFLGLKPKLVAVQIGKDPSSACYVSNQQKKASQIGIKYDLINLDEKISQEQLEQTIEKINQDDTVTGMILQTPLPGHLNFEKALLKIDPRKDAEGMHPQNLGALFQGIQKIAPCTPMAVMEMIKALNMDLYGKDVVVVGHSKIVGKPLAMMLLNENATVSICHIGTSDKGKLQEYTSKADILVVAVGVASLIKAEHIKEGAVLLDVGINTVEDKICGDVDMPSVESKASVLTPVPGGVGTLTTIMLMDNVVKLAEK